MTQKGQRSDPRRPAGSVFIFPSLVCVYTHDGVSFRALVCGNRPCPYDSLLLVVTAAAMSRSLGVLCIWLSLVRLKKNHIKRNGKALGCVSFVGFSAEGTDRILKVRGKFQPCEGMG